MSQTMLQVSGLRAALETGDEIVKGLDLAIAGGETHVIMGPNGAGKSTLANVIMGHPDYRVTGGSIGFAGEEITGLRTDERARRGIFLSFQAPEEVDGITVSDFLLTARSAVGKGPVKAVAFRRELEQAMELLRFDTAYAKRYLNVGFSGGEKKKHEILQMLMLRPKLAILDETDSGLDVDAVKTVTEGVRHFKNGENALLIISHSAKLLENMEVDYVHILVDGVIVHTGDQGLIGEVNGNGFAHFLHAESYKR